MDTTYQIEKNMQIFFKSLSEKDRRRYAAIEAQKIGRGGITYISAFLGCDEKTIRKGITEFDDADAMERENIRSLGGGPHSKINSIPNINEIFLEIVNKYTAGNPMNKDVKWTNLTKGDIIKHLANRGIKVSKNIVRKLLKKNKFVKRKAQKSKSIQQHKDRDKQFKKIFKTRDEYELSNNPVISIDTKKVEKVGNLYRDGHLECVEPAQVYDHDFPHLSYGKIIPYTIFDMKSNEAFVYIGTTSDTSELACDAIKIWWNKLGKKRYPNANSVFCLADGGGSNSSHSDLFKEDLQNIANDIHLDIHVAHYPPGTSKWNPIEHRVFPHITRSLAGVVLKSINLAQELISKTKTSTGLKVFTRVSRKLYEKGRKISEDFSNNVKIIRDNVLGQWNYMIFHDA